MTDVAIPNVWLLALESQEKRGWWGVQTPFLPSLRGLPLPLIFWNSAPSRDQLETGQRFGFSVNYQTYQLFYKYKTENRK